MARDGTRNITTRVTTSRSLRHIPTRDPNILTLTMRLFDLKTTPNMKSAKGSITTILRSTRVILMKIIRLSLHAHFLSPQLLSVDNLILHWKQLSYLIQAVWSSGLREIGGNLPKLNFCEHFNSPFLNLCRVRMRKVTHLTNNLHATHKLWSATLQSVKFLSLCPRTKNELKSHKNFWVARPGIITRTLNDVLWQWKLKDEEKIASYKHIV